MPTMDLPRHGLTEQFKYIWNSIDSITKWKDPRKPLSYFLSSPGVGKTFFLREVMKKNNQDIPQDFKELSKNMVFLGISFYGDTKYDTAIEDKFIPQECVYLRLIYKNLIAGNDWDQFLSIYINYKTENNMGSLEILDIFEELLKAKYPNINSFVILVDEISKVPNIIIPPNIDSRADQVRSTICQIMEESDYKFSVIFSALDDIFIKNETTNSRRATSNILTLPLLEEDAIIDILSDKLKDYDLIKKQNGTWVDVTEDCERRKYMKVLSSISSGHPRSAEFILRAIYEKINDLENIVKFAANQLTRTYPTHIKLYVDKFIIPALLGTKMYYNDKINNVTINDLVSSGIFLDSKLNDLNSKISLLVPELILHNIPDNAFYKYELSDLMKLRFERGDAAFEAFLVKWEILMRKIRPKNLYKNISLFEYLKKPIVKDSKIEEMLKNIQFDATSDITKDVFHRDEKIALKANNIYYPTSKINPGFDSIFTFNKTSNESFPTFTLFNENKISRKNASKYLSKSEVNHKFNLTTKFVNDRVTNDISNNFFLAFFSRRMLKINAKLLPNNCLILGDKQLNELFGENLKKLFLNLNENDFIHYRIVHKDKCKQLKDSLNMNDIIHKKK